MDELLKLLFVHFLYLLMQLVVHVLDIVHKLVAKLG